MFLQEWRGINFALSYLDENFVTLKVFLSKDYLETQLIGSYKSDHSVKFEFNLKDVQKFVRIQHIGYHHIHHLNAKIPFYRLPEAMAALPELQKPRTTSLHPRDVRECLRLKLWDASAQAMIPLPHSGTGPS